MLDEIGDIGRPELTFDMRFMVGLIHHDFPANVRELFALIKSAVARCTGDTLGAEHLSPPIQALLLTYGSKRLADPRESERPAYQAPGYGEAPSLEALRASLTERKGNLSAVARDFARSRATVHQWLKMHGLDARDFRAAE